MSTNNNSTTEKPTISETVKKHPVISSITGIIVTAIIVIILLLSFKGCSPDDVPDGFDISVDPNASSEDVNSRTQEEIINDLNEKVKDGMINISMNLNPEFENSKAKGNLLISNSDVNKYPQFVTITRNDTGETIYKSGGIAPGSRIDSAALAVNLDKGTYDCTALFTQYNADTMTELGSAAAKISILILN